MDPAWLTFATTHWAPLAAAAGLGAILTLVIGRLRSPLRGYSLPRRSALRGGLPQQSERVSTGMQRRIHTLETQSLELVRLFVLLPDLARDLSEAVDRRSIVTLLVERTAELFPEAPCVAFFAPPEEPGMPLTVEHATQMPGVETDTSGGVPVGKGVVGQAFATGETLTHARLRQRLSHFEIDEVFSDDPTPFPVWAAVPLTYGGETLGVLAIAHPGRFWASEEPDAPDPLRVISVVADVGAITMEHAENLDALGRLNEQLQVLDRLKSEFVSMVSHDLRTPLTSVNAALQNLADGVAGPLNEQQGEYLTMMRNEIGRLVRLINALLDLQRIEAGGVELGRVRVHMRPLVERTLKVLRQSLEEKEIRTDLSQLPNDLAAQADPDRLSQVLFNLLDNACKFTPPGGRIVLQGEARGEIVVVGVTNTGPVISEEQARVVFDRFRQLKSETGERPPGAGLGLAIAQRLIRLHGGEIWVRGIPGTGTRFAFSIPAEVPP